MADFNELENITAPTESTSTAAAAHAQGSYLIYDGKLYQATANIAIGDTLATTGAGANIAQVTGGAMGEVDNLKSAFDNTQEKLLIAWKTSSTYPGGWRPGLYNSSGTASSSTTAKAIRTNVLYNFNASKISFEAPEGLTLYANEYTQQSSPSANTFTGKLLYSDENGVLEFIPDLNKWYGFTLRSLPSTDYTSYITPEYVNNNLHLYQFVTAYAGIQRVKYVSTSGSDDRSGNSLVDAYATLGKALNSNASKIIVAPGTYNQSVFKIGGNYEIEGYGAIFESTSNALRFENCTVKISGVKVIVQDGAASTVCGFMMDRCKATLVDCESVNAPDMGFMLSGSTVTCLRCKVSNSGVDGFNAHDRASTEAYPDAAIAEGTFIDCVADGCGDDGLSYHEYGKLHVHGGKYINNGSTGIAPHNACNAEIIGAYIAGNNSGIETNNPNAEIEKPLCVVNGCIIVDNVSERSGRGYALSATNYKVYFNACLTHGNSAGRVNTGSGAEIIDSNNV